MKKNMEINLYKKQKLEIPKDSFVYTLMMTDRWDDDPLICDRAWTEKKEVYVHFWTKTPSIKFRIIKLKLKTYLKRHLKEVPSMNPIYEIARQQFIALNKEYFY